MRLLAPRHLVEHERAAHRLSRRLTLPVPELLPVDVGPHRVDLLLDQPPDEVLDATVDLPIHERRRRLEADARRQLPEHLRAQLPVLLVQRLMLEILAHAPAQRLERFVVPEILRELVVERRGRRGA